MSRAALRVSGEAIGVEFAAGRARSPVLQTLGALLIALSLVPVYRLLDRPETGLAGAATLSMAELNTDLLWAGFALLAGLSVIVALLVRPGKPAGWVSDVGRRIGESRVVVWSGVAGLGAVVGSAVFSLVVLRGQPNLIDAMSQLLHAGFLAAGRLAGPGPELGEFWTMQQSLFTERGWVSQYPPGQVLVLAVGLCLGVVWLVGPLALGAGAALLVAVAARLLPHAPATARFGGALLAVSPFAVAHAGAYSSHTTALALGVAAVYFALRAAEGPAAWNLGAGAALAAMLATRPLSAVALGIAMLFFLPVGRAEGRLRRLALLAVGAAPLLVALGAWNHVLFGSPLRWGYQAALGPAGGPGFGVDPWGNAYGPVEALGYVSAELGALSLNLLETPVPVVAVIGLFLVASPRLEPGERFLVAWALLPLAAHLSYWHHGLFMGPRMLGEMAPAWCLLAARSAVAVTERAPTRLSFSRFSPRVFAASLVAASLAAGLLYLGPERLWSYRQRPEAPATALAARPPAVVFVHGGWTSRLAMRLAAGGMRLDSVETALRQNPTCAVQRWADAKRSGSPLPALDFTPRATRLPEVFELSPGNRIRVSGAAPLSGRCAVEAHADRLGVIDVSPLVWLGDLPGVEGEGTLIVRDLGPADNARLLERHPERAAWVLLTGSPESAPALVPYAEGMALLWGTG